MSTMTKSAFLAEFQQPRFQGMFEEVRAADANLPVRSAHAVQQHPMVLRTKNAIGGTDTIWFDTVHELPLVGRCLCALSSGDTVSFKGLSKFESEVPPGLKTLFFRRIEQVAKEHGLAVAKISERWTTVAGHDPVVVYHCRWAVYLSDGVVAVFHTNWVQPVPENEAAEHKTPLWTNLHAWLTSEAAHRADTRRARHGGVNTVKAAPPAPVVVEPPKPAVVEAPAAPKLGVIVPAPQARPQDLVDHFAKPKKDNPKKRR